VISSRLPRRFLRRASDRTGRVDVRHRLRLVLYTDATGFAGGEQVLALLLDHLPADQFEASCICTSKHTLEALQRRLQRQDVSLVSFDMGSRPSILRTVWPLSRLLRSLDPDIVHCNGIDQYAGSYAIMAARLVRVPVVVGTVHTSGPHPQRTWPARVFGWVVDHCLDAAILVSDYCREPVLRDRHFRPAQLTVIRNGIALPTAGHFVRESHGPSDISGGAPVVIGSAGALIARKSFGTLLRASELLAAKHDIHVIIYGEGPERGRLESLSQQCGLSDRVELPGWRDDIYSALEALDIFVLPSLNESAGLVLLEAMACGLPVVATRVGGIPEYVAEGETGLLVPPRDPQALAAAIESLIVDPARREALGRAGRRRVEERFTAERMVAQTVQLYRRLLGR